jgi:hypothetical protein
MHQRPSPAKPLRLAKSAGRHVPAANVANPIDVRANVHKLEKNVRPAA